MLVEDVPLDDNTDVLEETGDQSTDKREDNVPDNPQIEEIEQTTDNVEEDGIHHNRENPSVE